MNNIHSEMLFNLGVRNLYTMAPGSLLPSSPLLLCPTLNSTFFLTSNVTHLPFSRSNRCQATIVRSSSLWPSQDAPNAVRKVLAGTATLVATLALSLSSVPAPVLAAAEGSDFQTYYGTAASASSYGGYGGNASKRDTAEYAYEVPQAWKERLISKVEKGTNGTDSEFYNPRRKQEKVYVTFLSGFPRLPPVDAVLNNLALSDVSLQDLIGSAESTKSDQRMDPKGQLYYDFEIDGPAGHSLIAVTCSKNKLYSHFVMSPSADWSRDEALLRHIHESFGTLGANSLPNV